MNNPETTLFSPCIYKILLKSSSAQKRQQKNFLWIIFSIALQTVLNQTFTLFYLRGIYVTQGYII